MKKFSILAAALGTALAGALQAAPVGDALQRPAMNVRQPERVVLQSAAQAGERIVAVGERGVIVVSDDAGRSWRQVPSPVSVTLTAVRSADAQHLVAVGHGGTVLTSEDRGASWTRRLDGLQLARITLEAVQQQGHAAAIHDAERLVADGPDKPLFDVAVFDARRFVVVGAYGLAFSTEDGGRSWRSWAARLDNPKGHHLYVARRLGDSLLLAGEMGLVLRSDDGGATFRRLASPYKGSWFTGEMVSSSEIVLAGLRGNVWRSGDAGVTWAQLPNQVPASITASLVDGGQLYLASQSGVVLRLLGGGLAPVNSEPLPPPNALISVGGKLLALGLGGVLPVQGARP